MAHDMNDIVEKSEVLVLSDIQGNIFAVPRPIVEGYVLTPAQMLDVHKELGDDVAGFQMSNFYNAERLSALHQADLLKEADQSRKVRDALAARREQRGSVTASDRGPGVPEGFVNFLIGVCRTLTTARPAPPASDQP